MRNAPFVLLATTMMLLCGCALDPYRAEIQRLQPQVESLEQRVGRLEEARLGSSKSGTSAVGSAGSMTFGETAAGSQGVVEEGAGHPFRFPNLIPSRKAFGKLGRGLTNVATGWVEIPKRIHETARTSGVPGGLTLGLVRGFGYGFIRTAAGAYETVTFPFPAPSDYRPVMRPAYVFTDPDNEG